MNARSSPLLWVIFVFAVLINNSARCAKILGVFPAPGYSQFILGEKLMSELATRGHHVTVISAFSPKRPHPNYRTVNTTSILDAMFFEDDYLFSSNSISIFSKMAHLSEFGFTIAEHTLQHENVQKLLSDPGEAFDLVVVEQFFMEALNGLAHHFECPLVVFSSIGPCEWNNPIMGNPHLPSITPISHSFHSNHMGFLQRLENTAAFVFHRIHKSFLMDPRHVALAKKHFPKSNSADFETALKNASLMLLNSHFTTAGDHATVNGMVEIGGFHVEAKELSQDLQKFLDDAKDGAIYFSLGTNIKSSDLGEEKIGAILRVFSKLKQRVLWKFERGLEDKPGNVLVSSWFKQSDILAHPNIKLFITHGGMLSFTEAVYHGVPFLGMPVFGDQGMNMARAERRGIAKVISLQDLTEEKFYAAINETLSNAKYKENAKKLSELLRDRSVKPMDLAVYWLEYVIRHRGAHFKSPVLELHWYQIWSLDVAALLASILIALGLLIRLILIRSAFGVFSAGGPTENRSTKHKRN